MKELRSSLAQSKLLRQKIKKSLGWKNYCKKVDKKKEKLSRLAKLNLKNSIKIKQWDFNKAYKKKINKLINLYKN